jgi:uncharacterized protein (TIGR03118 family)
VLEQRCVPAYVQTNLVSDIPGLAPNTEGNLQNPWGISEAPLGQFLVAANKTGQAIAIFPDGTPMGPVVSIPAPPSAPPGTVSAPNGDITNPTHDFVISEGGRSAPAAVLFSTEDGTIAAWNGSVDKTNALIVNDQSAAGAVYKLLAMGHNSQGNFLFATNFHNGTVDVFDKNFNLVHLAGSFTDPNTPADFAPFGIKNINGTLFVTYAKQLLPDKHDDQEGPGNGFIDEFDTNGNFLGRFASGTAAGGTLTQLNSPIGMAVAPANFGEFSNALLVGNFGDSHVSAFNLQTGAFLGQLSDAQGNPLVLNGGFAESNTKGLWGITFGNGNNGASRHALFFAAGINLENDGLFGKVTVVDPAVGHTGATPSAAVPDRSADLGSMAQALLGQTTALPAPAGLPNPGAGARVTSAAQVQAPPPGSSNTPPPAPGAGSSQAVPAHAGSLELIDLVFSDFDRDTLG